MARPQVLFMDQDLYTFGIYKKQLVENLPDIHERRTFKRDKLMANAYTLQVRNVDRDFNLGNPNAFLYGQNWFYQDILIINRDGETIWSGIVTDIRNDDRKQIAYIETKNKIYQYKNPIAYESSDWETPAKALENIFIQEAFVDYDSAQLTISHNILNENFCYVKVNINRSDNLTLFQVAEKLGVYGAADVFHHLNNLHYVHWRSMESAPNYTLNENDLKQRPIIQFLTDQIINQYNIGYDGDLEKSDSDIDGVGRISRLKAWGTQMLTELRSGNASEQITFKDLTSAQYIGETMIYRTHYEPLGECRPRIKIQFDIHYSLKGYFNLSDYFRFNYSSWGWVNKIFQVMEIKGNEMKQNINIVAYEV